MKHAIHMFSTALVAAALAGCPYASGQHEKFAPGVAPKDPEATALPAEPPALPKPSPTVLAAEPTDAGPSETVSPAEADAGAPVAKTPPKPNPKPTVAAAPAGGDAPACGSKDNPCPMQKFMRAQMVTATTPDALAAAFAKAASLSPEAGWSWKSMSQKGAESAKSGDVPGAKAQCKACHDAYKEKYKAQYRARPVK